MHYTKEEKKAIENIKEELHINGLGARYTELKSEDLEILLSLLKKQQKEIYRLENKEYMKLENDNREWKKELNEKDKSDIEFIINDIRSGKKIVNKALSEYIDLLSNKVLLKQGYVSIEKYNKLLEKYDKGINKLMNIKLYACDINKNKECEKKHCYINGGECDATTDKTKVKYVNLDDYIPKEAVKEKIKEIEDSLKENCIALHEFQRLAKIDILKELLGE